MYAHLLLLQGGDSEALECLSKLMLSLDSYYHPSNHGKHTVSCNIYCICDTKFVLFPI